MRYLEHEQEECQILRFAQDDGEAYSSQLLAFSWDTVRIVESIQRSCERKLLSSAGSSDVFDVSSGRVSARDKIRENSS